MWILATAALVVGVHCSSPPEAPVAPLVQTPQAEQTAKSSEAESAKTPAADQAGQENGAGAGGQAPSQGADKGGEKAPAAKADNRPIVSPHTGPPADGTFVWVDGGAEFIDPNKSAESAGGRIVMNLFEGLATYALGDGPPVPGVATHWEVLDGHRKYIFHLRKDAKWSNGRTVTAADFVYSWKRALSPETASKAASNLWYIRGARDFNEGKTTDFSTVGIRAPDPYTLEVDLSGPTPFFIHLVAYGTFAPVPKEAVDAHGKQWTRPENIVTNGPFLLKEWKIRDKVVMEKNPTYWDASSVKLKRAIIVHNESETNALRLYESQKVHWTPGQVPPDKLRTLVKDGRTDVHTDPMLCLNYYWFRMDRKPFNDPNVRRAVNMAIDKERIAKHILGTGQVPATHLVPPTVEPLMGYSPAEGDAFDPDRAKELLAKAGYPNGEGMSGMEIIYNTYELNRIMAESMQRNLSDTLGIKANINNMEWKSLLKKLHSGDFQFGRGGWCADYPDPMTFLDVFDSKNEHNYGGYSNPEYDALLEAIKAEADAEKRRSLIAKAEALLNQDVPIVPIYFYTRSYLLSPYVRGFEPQYQDNHPLKYIHFEE